MVTPFLIHTRDVMPLPTETPLWVLIIIIAILWRLAIGGPRSAQSPIHSDSGKASKATDGFYVAWCFSTEKRSWSSNNMAAIIGACPAFHEKLNPESTKRPQQRGRQNYLYDHLTDWLTINSKVKSGDHKFLRFASFFLLSWWIPYINPPVCTYELWPTWRLDCPPSPRGQWSAL